MIPLSLYVHIPWCVRKCPYCDFNSHRQDDRFDESRYIDALVHDLDNEREQNPAPALTSIFFGGGTPSLFSADAIARVLDEAGRRFELDADIEITLEANPGTFEQEKFAAYRQAGINRLSIGIQSFNQRHLETLGRIHDAGQARAAIDTAFTAGFDNINLDLMFGLPEQDVAQSIDDVQTAIDAGVTHISHYQLTIEPNTLFHRHPPVLPDSDLLWDMQLRCQSLLADCGFEQYEISAYARDGRTAKHNTNYWQFGDYIGIGAGAHGKQTMVDDAGVMQILRRRKHRQPQMYMHEAMKGLAVSSEETISHDDRCFEFLLNALRLKRGVDSSLFSVRTGLQLDELRRYTRDIDPGLLHIDEQRIGTSDRGYLFLNEILEKLV